MVDLRLLELVQFTGAAVLILITLTTLCIQFARKKSQYMRTMILTWTALMAMTSFKTVHVWLVPTPSESTDIWIFLETLSAILAGFSYIVLVDSLSRENIEPIKLALFSCYIGTSLYVSVTNPALGQSFFIIGIQALMGFTWFYYCARIFRNAPKSLKFYAGLNLLGSSSVFCAIILGASGLSALSPGCEWVAIGLGNLCTTIAFVKREQLAFCSPFGSFA